MLFRTSTLLHQTNAIYYIVYSILFLYGNTPSYLWATETGELVRPRHVSHTEEILAESALTLRYNPSKCKYKEIAELIKSLESKEQSNSMAVILFRQLHATLAGGFSYKNVIKDDALTTAYQLYQSEIPINLRRSLRETSPQAQVTNTGAEILLLPYDVFEIILKYISVKNQSSLSISCRGLHDKVKKYWNKNYLVNFLLRAPTTSELLKNLEDAFEYTGIPNQLFLPIGDWDWSIAIECFGMTKENALDLGNLIMLIHNLLEQTRDTCAINKPRILLKQIELKRLAAEESQTLIRDSPFDQVQYDLSVRYNLEYLPPHASDADKAALLPTLSRGNYISSIMLKRRVLTLKAFTLQFNSVQLPEEVIGTANIMMEKNRFVLVPSKNNTCFGSLPSAHDGPSVRQRAKKWGDKTTNATPFLPDGFGFLINHEPVKVIKK